MTVVRDVLLELREGPRRRGLASQLRLRVLNDAGMCELRGEDLAGNLHFHYRDLRAFCVLHEFESTLAELQGDYRAVVAALGHG